MQHSKEMYKLQKRTSECSTNLSFNQFINIYIRNCHCRAFLLPAKAISHKTGSRLFGYNIILYEYLEVLHLADNGNLVVIISLVIYCRLVTGGM